MPKTAKCPKLASSPKRSTRWTIPDHINYKGEVEGVDYDLVGVVLANAVKEQQAQIEAQAVQIEQQRVEIELLKKKAAEVGEIKTIVCRQKPDTELCRRRN